MLLHKITDSMQACSCGSVTHWNDHKLCTKILYNMACYMLLTLYHVCRAQVLASFQQVKSFGCFSLHASSSLKKLAYNKKLQADYILEL